MSLTTDIYRKLIVNQSKCFSLLNDLPKAVELLDDYIKIVLSYDSSCSSTYKSLSKSKQTLSNNSTQSQTRPSDRSSAVESTPLYSWAL